MFHREIAMMESFCGPVFRLEHRNVLKKNPAKRSYTYRFPSDQTPKLDIVAIDHAKEPFPFVRMESYSYVNAMETCKKVYLTYVRSK